MGVTGLWKLIDQAGKPVPLDTLENKILAVDISIWLHQVVKGFQDNKGGVLPHAHLLGLFHRLCKLMYYKIKPVFVFDGGVPQLKRETIRRRNLNKNKYNSEADRLQQLLLESLAKEKVIQQALGSTAAALLLSPSSKERTPTKVASCSKEDDLFKLPPSLDVSTEEDGSFDEKISRQSYDINLRSIDVTSSKFKEIPADIRYEILTDIKEKRKESSWGRLHEFPAERNDFSSFQMSRLLKRRQVQIGLETAEKEMGGKCLSLAEMETLMNEDGLVESSTAAKRIASDENTRYLHVRNLKQSLNDVKEEPQDRLAEATTSTLVEDVKKEVTSCSDNISDVKLDKELDADLQKAIQLSLEACCDSLSTSSDDDEVKLSTEQKKAFGNAANTLAKAYMIEYGGMNSEDVDRLVSVDAAADDKDADKTFKYNDTLIVGEDDEVSSDADSDFIEVPDVSDVDLNSPIKEIRNLKMNVAPTVLDKSKDFRINDLGKSPLEIVVTAKQLPVDDDLFADIFAGKNESVDEVTTILDSQEEIEISKNISKSLTNCKQSSLNGILSDLNEEVQLVKSKLDPTVPLTEHLNEELVKSKLEPPTPQSEPNLDAILHNLNSEINEIDRLDLDSLKSDAIETNSLVRTPSKRTYSKTDSLADASPKSREPLTPTTIKSPFFRKRTPSSKKKLPTEPDHMGSKVSKSLFAGEESKPKETTEEIIEQTAQALREQKTDGELNEMATEIHQQRQDIEFERNKQDRLGVSITDRMSEDCKHLLRLFGIPYIVAPMEAEAQCAFLDECNLTDGTITDDSDIWLFGGKTVYKHFFNQQKSVLEFQSTNIERYFNLDRHKLIQLSVLVGNDYTNGIAGIGAVTAMEIISSFSSTPSKEDETSEKMSVLSGLRKFRAWWEHGKAYESAKIALRSKLRNVLIGQDFPNHNVIDAFLYPHVDSNKEKFSWGTPDAESIREYAKQTFGWTYSKTDDILMPVLKKLNQKISQSSIRNYFTNTSAAAGNDSIVANLQVSKRVKRAIQGMSVNHQDVVDEPHVKKKKARKPRAKKTVNDEIDMEEAAASATSGISPIVPKKVPHIPTPVPIFQREKAETEISQNKIKAIELFNKTKSIKNKKK